MSRFTLSFASFHQILGLENGLALTPPMGWLSWERFGCNTDCQSFPDSCISENLYAEMADRIVELGLDKVGYRFVNIDDCWSTRERAKDGIIREDPSRFPRGMRWLSKYIHNKGLKFGLYTDIGTKTCAGYPGLAGGHMQSDIEKFVEWEIDSLKVDGCYADVDSLGFLYSSLSQVLNETTRPILFSCSWPAYEPDHCENPEDIETLKRIANLWRNFDDISDSVCFFNFSYVNILVEICSNYN
jgi:hypothetical protein